MPIQLEKKAHLNGATATSCGEPTQGGKSEEIKDLLALQSSLARRYPSYRNTVGMLFKVFEQLQMSPRQIKRFCGRHIESLNFFQRFENIATRGDVSVNNFIQKLWEEDDRLPDSMFEIIVMMLSRFISWLKRAGR